MPTYEYECTQCQRRFEEFQSITARPLKRIKTDCQDCDGKAPVQRLLSTGAAVLFKGSGFYETDYRSESYKKAAKADSESTKKTDGDKSSSDTKKSSESKDSTKKKSTKSSGDKPSSKGKKSE